MLLFRLKSMVGLHKKKFFQFFEKNILQLSLYFFFLLKYKVNLWQAPACYLVVKGQNLYLINLL